jgi:hypothetical protein
MNHTRSSRALMIQRTETAREPAASLSPVVVVVVFVVVVADMKFKAASRPEVSPARGQSRAART